MGSNQTKISTISFITLKTHLWDMERSLKFQLKQPTQYQRQTDLKFLNKLKRIFPATASTQIVENSTVSVLKTDKYAVHSVGAPIVVTSSPRREIYQLRKRKA